MEYYYSITNEIVFGLRKVWANDAEYEMLYYEEIQALSYVFGEFERDTWFRV